MPIVTKKADLPRLIIIKNTVSLLTAWYLEEQSYRYVIHITLKTSTGISMFLGGHTYSKVLTWSVLTGVYIYITMFPHIFRLTLTKVCANQIHTGPCRE